MVKVGSPWELWALRAHGPHNQLLEVHTHVHILHLPQRPQIVKTRLLLLTGEAQPAVEILQPLTASFLHCGCGIGIGLGNDEGRLGSGIMGNFCSNVVDFIDLQKWMRFSRILSIEVFAGSWLVDVNSLYYFILFNMPCHALCFVEDSDWYCSM